MTRLYWSSLKEMNNNGTGSTDWRMVCFSEGVEVTCVCTVMQTQYPRAVLRGALWYIMCLTCLGFIDAETFSVRHVALKTTTATACPQLSVLPTWSQISPFVSTRISQWNDNPATTPPTHALYFRAHISIGRYLFSSVPTVRFKRRD